ncbi:protein LSM12-like [Ptychodera flava]|uniref:protein LSM12-like n=1 Tax=Ptychodera flava TaxID=63121 RepID=UPI003969F481
MLIKMATPNETSDSFFKVGSYVTCTTCHGQKVEGEVMAFDVPTRMLALKATASNSSKPNHCDIRLINLFLVSNVSVEKEATEVPPPPPYLNLQKLTARCNSEVEAKKQAVYSIGVDVTAEAQKLFNTIQKTLKCQWQDKTIVVLDEMTIVPPYGVENCKSKDGKLLSHVIKIVEKHIRDQQQQQQQQSGST